MKAVFIGGCDRSGTTLLGSMLGAADGCITTPESQFKFPLLRWANQELCLSDIKDILSEIAPNFRFKLWRSAVPGVERFLQAKKAVMLREVLFEVVWEYACSLSRETFECWIDHTPANIRYLHTLSKVFPEARFVHIVRDGRAVAASVIPLLWGPNTVYHAAAWWAERLSFGLAAEHALPKKVHRVRYEDLVQKPTETLCRLCDALEIQFEEQMVESKGFRVPEYTIHQHQLVGRPPDRARVEAWRKELDGRDVEVFEYLAGDLLQSLGYEPIFDTPETYTRSQLWKFRAAELFGQVRNRVLQKNRQRTIANK
jgi:hypothetical protein